MSGGLRRIDRAVVPRLARFLTWLSSWGDPGRWRLRVLTALGLTASVAAVVTVVWASHSQAPEVRGRPEKGPVLRVGVGQGQSIPGYISSSQGELDAMVTAGDAAVETYALVSLNSYLAPDRLTPVLGGVTVAEVYTRVPLTGAQTQIVRIPAFRIPEDVISGMREVATHKEADARDLRSLAAKLSEVNAAEDRVRQTYLDEASLAAAEASAYRTGCTCVYAAVVRATPAALDQIAGRPEVRAVDPAPEVRRLDQAVFLAPLPEQQDLALPAPSEAPQPSPSPSPTPSAQPSPTVSDPSPSVSATRSIESRR